MQSLKPFFQRLQGIVKPNVYSWSKKMGFNEPTVNKWLKKGSIPGADKIMIICEKEGISADWLLTGKEPSTKGRESESPRIREEIGRLQERADFYKEKADFYEKKLKDYEEKLKSYEEKLKNAEKAFFDLKRDGDNNGFDPKLVRKIPW